ncbi:MAG: phosphodiester glycosidase family protein [Roseobacter sp.]
MIRLLGMALTLCLLASGANAVTCQSIEFDDQPYTVCEVQPQSEQMELYLRNADGALFGQFSTINRSLETSGQRLVFAMNAGMYHDDRSPVGHYVEDGKEIMRVISNAGPGNFGLLPNGILCLRPGRADVFETKAFLELAPQCVDATQSGPMLVIDGALHPKFLADGTSRYIRNGVGTSADGTRAVFAISDTPVNFHTFGRLFLDHLELPNALYLDGNISRLYAPELDRSDFGFALGPIVGVVAPIE